MSKSLQPYYYLGPEGSHSHGVALQLFNPETNYLVSCSSFGKVFELLDTDCSSRAVIPLENSIGGNVIEVMDRVMTGQYRIIAEKYTQIKHFLAMKQGVTLSQIRKIYVHPQAKLQCSHFLNQYPDIELVIANSTSQGAMLINQSQDTTIATICSSIAIELYELQSDMVSIANTTSNYTRFLVIEALNAPLSQSNILEISPVKTTIIFELEHTVGSLYRVLDLIAQQGLNLTKIESGPIPENPFCYRFLCECVGSHGLKLEPLRAITSKLMLVGVYVGDSF